MNWVLKRLNCSWKIKYPLQKSHRSWLYSLPGLNNFFLCEWGKQDFPPFTAFKSFAHLHETCFYNVFHMTSRGSSIPSFQMSLKNCFGGLQETNCIKRTLKVQFCLILSCQPMPSCITGPPISLQGTSQPEAEKQTLPQALCHPSVAKPLRSTWG